MSSCVGNHDGMASLFLHIHFIIFQQGRHIYVSNTKLVKLQCTRKWGSVFVRVDCLLPSQQITVKNLKSRVKNVKVRMRRNADVPVRNMITGI